MKSGPRATSAEQIKLSSLRGSEYYYLRTENDDLLSGGRSKSR